jgi:hypothetical protein
MCLVHSVHAGRVAVQPGSSEMVDICLMSLCKLCLPQQACMCASAACLILACKLCAAHASCALCTHNDSQRDCMTCCI